MIRIEIEKDKVTLKGHAEYNPGHDIVCAAVSALFYTLLGYLEEKARVDEAKEESGDAWITFHGGGEALEMFSLGVRQISETYPENVKVVTG